MQRRGSAGGWYAVAAMVLAGSLGRALDGGALLPGVSEGAAVRGSGAAWAVALAVSAVLGVATAAGWRRTRSLRAIAAQVAVGQGVVFLAGETVARIGRGQGLLDADGLLGALLQAAVALALLSVLALTWVVVTIAAGLRVRRVPVRRDRPELLVVLLPKGARRCRSARAPPAGPCTRAA